MKNKRPRDLSQIAHIHQPACAKRPEVTSSYESDKERKRKKERTRLQDYGAKYDISDDFKYSINKQECHICKYGPLRATAASGRAAPTWKIPADKIKPRQKGM